MSIRVMAFAPHGLSLPEVKRVPAILTRVRRSLHELGAALGTRADLQQEWSFDIEPIQGQLGEDQTLLQLGDTYSIQISPRVMIHAPNCKWQAFVARETLRHKVVQVVREVAACLDSQCLLWTNESAAAAAVELACSGAQFGEIEDTFLKDFGVASPSILDKNLMVHGTFDYWATEVL